MGRGTHEIWVQRFLVLLFVVLALGAWSQIATRFFL